MDKDHAVMTRTPRKVAALAFAATAALGLAACSPPNQQDSGEKVDTATSQNPDSLAGQSQIGGTEVTGAPNATDANASAQATTSAERAEANASPDGSPVYVSCETEAKHKPDRIILNCKDRNDVAENIVWTTWNDEIAQGTATRNDIANNRVVDNAQIVLSTPEVVDGVLVFTQVAIDGANVSPQTDY